MKKRLLPALCVVFVSTSVVAESTRAIVLDTESKTVAIVDAATGSVGERVTLMFSSDGTSLTVLTPGVASNKPAEVKAAALIRIDAKTGEVLKRVTLDRAADSFEVSSNGSTGAIFFSPSNPKPAEIRLVDVGSLDTVATITLSN